MLYHLENQSFTKNEGRCQWFSVIPFAVALPVKRRSLTVASRQNFDPSPERSCPYGTYPNRELAVKTRMQTILKEPVNVEPVAVDE